jgi:copper chaperone
MEILVFKTDVRSKKRVNEITPHLQKMKGIIKWNVDLQDVDKVLRIECASISPDAIEKILQQAGYYCKELTD